MSTTPLRRSFLRSASRTAVAWSLVATVVFGRGRTLSGQELPRFREQTISKEVKFGYQLVAADLDGDGKKDLIAIDEAAAQLGWFENRHPTWKRHVLAVDVPRPLNADCWDVDGDGAAEVVLAYRFEPSPERSVGSVVLLHRGADVRQPWTAREIDRVPTAHRVRWIDPEGNGHKVLLVAPVVGRQYPPAFDDPVPIYLYRPGQWKRETLSSRPQGILHAIHPVNWDGGARQQLLTASYSGLDRIELVDGKWVATHLTKGDPAPCPKCGSSEVRVGRLGNTRFLAAIEPWHGNQVVVYLPNGEQWSRLVIDDRMTNGHALAVGDLDHLHGGAASAQVEHTASDQQIHSRTIGPLRRGQTLAGDTEQPASAAGT